MLIAQNEATRCNDNEECHGSKGKSSQIVFNEQMTVESVGWATFLPVLVFMGLFVLNL